jgi:hypothetical protein
MPDEVNIFEQAVILASTYRGVEIRLTQVNPYGTSSTNYVCSRKMLRGPGQWDYAKCSLCGIEVNTHLNAAKFIRDSGFSN